jgi:Domain of unknown function (DUF4382)
VRNSTRKLSAVLVLLGTLSLTACGGGGGGGGGGSSTPTGTLGVSLTDSPACGFDAVYVTVSQVRVHQSAAASATAAGWSTISLNPPKKVNLLGLSNGVLLSLGQTPLPAGHYTQLRLVLVANSGSTTANSVVLTGTTTEVPISTPSAVQSGIKLINQFDVAAGQRTDLALDFDACKSIVVRGAGTANYALMPVIRVIPFVANGIEGYVDPSLLLNNNSTYEVMAYAEQNGVIVRATAPDPSTGKFFLARLDPGNYDVVVTANTHPAAATGYGTSVIASVPVASTTSIVDVSTSAAPLTLSVSATHTLSGKVTLSPSNSSVVAYVAAQQAFSSGPTVTVQSQSASLLDGSYSMSLPAAAPELGPYATPLPIVFTAQTSVAGQYTASASADGYQTQSSPEDVFASDQVYSPSLTQ